DAYAAADREDVAFERGADAVGNHRYAVAPADVHDVAHLLGRLGEHDRVGRRIRKVRLVLAVVLAHRARGADALAEQRAQLGDDALIEFPGLVHREAPASGLL